MFTSSRLLSIYSRQTVGGRQNLDAYSTKTIGVYAEELMGYSVAKSYILDAAIALVFWRGQVRVIGIWLPGELTGYQLFATIT